ncbi:MAG: allantoinase AllB, partial [Planctomycetales bacterium]|nr:allantoinase AllB [Planctomycetales bacterium]
MMGFGQASQRPSPTDTFLSSFISLRPRASQPALNANSPSNTFALYSRRVLGPDGLLQAAVVVRDDTILAVVPRDQLPDDCPCDDLGDLIVAPGVIDTNVCCCEPGRTDWEGFEHATKAAAAGGITTLFEMPVGCHPATTSLEALQLKRLAADGQCHVDVGFFGGLTPHNGREVDALVAAGVFGIKAYLCPSGFADFPLCSSQQLQRAMPLLAEANLPLLVHSELPAGQFAVTSDRRSYQQYVGSRADQWELDGVAQMAGLCRRFGCPVHILHLSSAEALTMIEWSIDEGLPLSVETAPHYLLFAAEEVADGDTRFKCSPPIRNRENREKLWRALESGLIDTIASDHAPFPAEMKSLDEGFFTTAFSGISGLQFTLSAAWTGAKRHGTRLDNLRLWLSDYPARLYS